MHVPNLKTAMTGPMMEVERAILDNATAIERWFRLQWQDLFRYPVYSVSTWKMERW